MTSPVANNALVTVSADTERLFDLVSEDVTHLWFDLKLYQGLFTEERVQILNRRTSGTFRIVQNRLYDAHHVRIARLLDEPEGRRRDTTSVSFSSLVKAVRGDGAAELANEMNAHLTDIRTAAAGIRWRRDKLIGHVDLDARLGKVELPDTPTFATIEQIANDASHLMNVYSSAVRGTAIGYNIGHLGLGGPDALIRELELAQKYRDEHPDHWMNEATRGHLRAQGQDPAEYARKSKDGRG